MFDQETFNKFLRTSTGCISPGGQLAACETYEHFKIMNVDQYYDEVYREYWDDANETVNQEAEDAGNDYYHPEWHRFEMGDDSKERAYMKAYNDGWIRLTYHRHHNMLYAESIKSVLERHKDLLQFINDCLENCELKLSIERER